MFTRLTIKLCRFSHSTIILIRQWGLMLVSWLMFANIAVAQSLTADVDRQSLTIEETLQYTLRYNGQGSVPNPNFSQMEVDFEVLNQSRNNQFRSFNGQVEAWTEWNLVLAPKREGTLNIPAMTLNNQTTNPITVEVNAAAPAAQGGAGKNLFIEAQLNVEKAYVQQQVLLTIRFHTAFEVANIQPETPELTNAKLEEISEKQYQRRINQKDYRVVEVIYAIYPQTSGELIIPSLRWDIAVGRRSSLFDFGQSGMNTRRRLRTEPLSATILPKPASFPQGATWLPASELSLSEAWPKSSGRFTQGDPISRTLILEAKGLTASQLPNLSPEYPTAINAYPEPLKKNETKTRQGIVTRIEQNQALVSTEAGQFTLPKVEIPWWNTKTDQLEVAEIPAKALLINAPEGRDGPATTPVLDRTAAVETDDNSNTPSLSTDNSEELLAKVPWWLYATNGLTLLLSVIFCLLWFLQKRKGHPTQKKTSGSLFSKRPETQAVIEACQAQDAQKTYERLRAWTIKVVGAENERAKNVVSQLSEILPENTQSALTKLDRHLFGAGLKLNVTPPTQEDFEIIANAVKQFKSQKKRDNQGSLAPLNPI